MGIFVLQVTGGQERHAAELVRKMLGDKVKDCFAPMRELKKRKAGQWRTVRELSWSSPDICSWRRTILQTYMRACDGLPF